MKNGLELSVLRHPVCKHMLRLAAVNIWCYILAAKGVKETNELLFFFFSVLSLLDRCQY